MDQNGDRASASTDGKAGSQCMAVSMSQSDQHREVIKKMHGCTDRADSDCYIQQVT